MALINYNAGKQEAENNTPYSTLFTIWDSQKTDQENWSAMALHEFTQFRDDPHFDTQQDWDDYVEDMKDEWDLNGYLTGISLADISEQLNFWSLIWLKFNKKFNNVDYV